MTRFLRLLPRKVVQGALVAVPVAAVSYIVKVALQASGVLDPLALRIGRVIGQHVSESGLAWTGAGLLAIVLYAGGIYGVARLTGTAAPPPPSAVAPPAASASPLQLEVGELEPLFVTSTNTTLIRRWLKLRVANDDPSRTMRRVTARIVDVAPSPGPGQRGPWTLFEDGIIEAGDSLLADIVNYAEPRFPDGAGDSFIQTGAFDRDLTLDMDHPSILTVRVTARDVAYADLRCLVWVDGQSRLRIVGLPAPADLLPGAWAPLVDVTRYLVEDSMWGAALAAEDDDFIKTAIQALKDHLADDLKARGRRATRNGGGYAQGLEAIPASFWPGAELDVFGMLGNPAAQSGVHDPRGVEWSDVVIDAQRVKALWPPAAAPKLVSNRYVLAIRADRVANSG